MIRSSWTFNTKPLDDLIEFASDFTRLVSDIGEDVFKANEDDLIDELRYYPAPPPNSTYVRTYRLQNGWTVGLERGTEGFSVVINNPTPYAKYVVGSFAKARSAAANLQAAIHRGRWPLAKDTLDFWYAEFLEEYEARFQKELSQFGTSTGRTRAFTR